MKVWTYVADSMDFVTVSTEFILSCWMGLPIRNIHICVNLSGLGKIGYVANSPYTVLGESYSAGRLYDKMSEEANGKVKFILDKGVICELIE